MATQTLLIDQRKSIEKSGTLQGLQLAQTNTILNSKETGTAEYNLHTILYYAACHTNYMFTGLRKIAIP